MSKNEKPKVFWDWKTGKRFALIGGILLTMSGAALAYNHAVHVQATTGDQETIVWEPGKALAHFKLSDGSTGEATQLLRKSDMKPTYCIGLGVPLDNPSTSAQEDAMNKIWVKLSAEEQDIINNISYLANEQGAKTNMDLYLGAQLAEWKVLYDAGAGEKDVASIESFGPGNPNGSVEKVNNYRDDLIKQAKKLVEKPSFDGKTIPLIMGVPTTLNDSNAVLPNFPIVKNNAKGLTEKIDKNSVTLTADVSSQKGIIKNALQFMNESQDKDYQPFVYSTGGDSTGDTSQSVFVGTEPSRLLSSLNVSIIGLGEFTLSKSSTNDAFSKAMMDGAEFTVYNASDDKPVKLSDGQDGHQITMTHGTSADKTNLVLKMGKDALVGAKNLDKFQTYYAKETKAPAGFALNAKKIPITFDKDSKFNADDSNYQDNVSVQDIPTGSVSGTKVDADTKTTTPQGIGNLKDVTYGAFWEDGTPMKWSDGLTDKTENSTENLPITLTAGTKVNDTNVEFKVDDKSNFGFQNIPLVKNKTRFYLQETATSPGYSLSTKKIWVDLSETNHVNVDTNDFDESGIKAEDKAAAIQIIFDKAQDVNGSFPGLNGAGFEGQPIDGNKEKTVKVTSGPGTDANGFQVNGLTVFDGKANIAAGNANPDGLAVANWKFVETNPPKGTVAINPFTLKSSIKSDKNGHPVSYHFVFTDDVTHQTIMESDVDASKLVDNNIALKVNLGTMVDKAKLPTIKTKAHSADGDQIIQIKEVSKTTRMYDDATFTNVEKGDQIFSYLHRIVTDKDGKVTDKVVKTLNFVADDETVKTQKHRFETTTDTTKDLDIPEGATVTYVFTEDDFDGNSNPKTDEPKAKHDDLKDQDQTLTVEKEKPTTPSSSTTPSTPDKPSTPSKNVIDLHLPKTGEGKAALGLSILGTVLLGLVAYLKRNWFVSVYRKIRK